MGVVPRLSSIDRSDTVSGETQQPQVIVTAQGLTHPVVAETGAINENLNNCIDAKECTMVLSQFSSQHGVTKVRDFAYEPRLSPLLLNSCNELPKAPPAVPESPPESPTAHRKPSLRSIASSSSLQITRKLSNLSLSSSRSTPLPPRLPRYLGNHASPAVSTLGRSVSLELPTLRQAYIPRRAISLPRITEHIKTALCARYISKQVNAAYLRDLSVVRRASTGRTPKTAVAAPSRVVRTRTQLHTSTIASASMDGEGFFGATTLGAEPWVPYAMEVAPFPRFPGFKEHGRWCRFKNWVAKKCRGPERLSGEEEGDGGAWGP
ncbi:hypothetical protein MMC18_006516 [Xylographa bjoerkii]|nr:hypothetical protein [Xylographa bjoerkii]